MGSALPRFASSIYVNHIPVAFSWSSPEQSTVMSYHYQKNQPQGYDDEFTVS
jgi:hypothetical protein